MSKDYSLIKEAEDHFMIGHPEHGEFKVAKKGVSKALQKKIKALPQALYAGGMPDRGTGIQQEDTQTTEDATAPEQNWYENMIQGSKGIGQDIGQKIGDVANTVQQSAPYQGVTGKSGNPNIKNVDFSPVELGQKEGEKSVVPAPEQPKQHEEKISPPPPTTPDYINGGFGEIKSGIAGGVKAVDEATKRTNAAVAENQLINQEQFNNYQQNVKDWQVEQDKLQKDYADGTIDPKRVWHKMETTDKITAGLSILLSSFGQGLIGGPNSAMQAINNSIDRDIDAQKADLGKKHNLLTMNLRKYGDINTAYQATKSQQLSALQAELQQIAATTNNATTKANALKEYGQIDLQKGQLQTNIHQTQFWNDVAAGRTPLAANQINAIPDSHKNLKDSAVVIPGQQRAYFTNDPKNADIVNKATQAALDLESSLKQAEQFQGKYGTTYNPYSAESKEAARIQKEVQLKTANYMEVNGKAMTPEQREEFSKTAGNPSSFFQTDAKNSFKNIRKVINGTLHSTYKTYLPTYDIPNLIDKEGEGKVTK